MKMRGFLLLLLLIGGAYAMLQSINEYTSKGFHEVLHVPENQIEQLIFTKPSATSTDPPAWMTTDREQIAMLLEFLNDYELKKRDSQEYLDDLNFNQFTISLEDSEHNLITIMIEDNFVVTHTGEQYTVLDGPLDVDWMVNFILLSHSS
ncbi:hypothetical protein [Sporosarcina aquimarina]|uniref:DUF4825 domain-containing protein n=1 Tax=Sporosarcina aquimarina TaxID=114975 RepID=A0ABU4FZZ0_9BACL|nr:hypothetical protein [Sporosarcina aquimarina]MDW0110286.1 hypothetical protein [Sporosarcina aquimarina]